MVSPAKTGFPLPPRAATASAATTSAPTATTTPAAATATASAATRFRRRCRRGYGQSGQSNSLEEVHSHHRDCCQDIRQGLQTYSTRHVSCHLNPFSPTMQVWISNPGAPNARQLPPAPPALVALEGITGSMDCEYLNGASLSGSSLPERCSSGVHVAIIMLVPVPVATLDEVAPGMQSTGRPRNIPLIIRNF